MISTAGSSSSSSAWASRSTTTTSASARSWRPRVVINPRSPGPPPTRATGPGRPAPRMGPDGQLAGVEEQLDRVPNRGRARQSPPPDTATLTSPPGRRRASMPTTRPPRRPGRTTPGLVRPRMRPRRRSLDLRAGMDQPGADEVSGRVLRGTQSSRPSESSLARSSHSDGATTATCASAEISRRPAGVATGPPPTTTTPPRDVE